MTSQYQSHQDKFHFPKFVAECSAERDGPVHRERRLPGSSAHLGQSGPREEGSLNDLHFRCIGQSYNDHYAPYLRL